MTDKDWLETSKELKGRGYQSVNCYLVSYRNHGPHILSKMSMEFCEGIFRNPITNAEINKGFPKGILDLYPLSRLPDRTVIETDEGFFEKGEGAWSSLHDHCGECGTIVMEDPNHKESPDGYPRVFANAEVYFKEFKVVQVPYISEKVLNA